MRKGPQSIWEIVEASKDALPCLIFSISFYYSVTN